MIEIDDLLGIPYKIHGRDLDGFDCYGLVIEVERRFGHEMIDYYGEYTNGDCVKVLDKNCNDFIRDMNLIETDSPSLGDIIVFLNDNGESVHVAVYLKRDDFIHCDGDGVSIANLNRYFRDKWKVYKWQK